MTTVIWGKMNVTKNIPALFLAFLAWCDVSGCAKTPDTKDPQQVAEAFWTAIIAGDYDKAVTYVLPKDRETFP